MEANSNFRFEFAIDALLDIVSLDPRFHCFTYSERVNELLAAVLPLAGIADPWPA
jgi:hypothetical protein